MIRINLMILAYSLFWLLFFEVAFSLISQMSQLNAEIRQQTLQLQKELQHAHPTVHCRDGQVP